MTEYRLEMSPELDKFAPAFHDFQTHVKDPAKNSTNPHFGSKFASLEDSIEAIRHVANTFGLTISQWRVGKGVTTLILHTSGQYIRGDAEMIIEKLTPQALGSAVTYERRYSLLGATGTSGDVDDDAEHAMMRDDPSTHSIADQPAPPAQDGQVKEFAALIGEVGSLADLRMVGIEINEAGLSQPKRDILKALYKTAEKRLS